MGITELWQQYNAQIITFVGTVGTLMPFLKKRLVNDQTIMKQFETVKEVTNNVSEKGISMAKSIGNLDQMTKMIGDQVDKLNERIGAKLAALDKSIINFQESEPFKKMQAGLEKLDKLEQMLEVKDNTIEVLGGTIKRLEAELQGIKNRL